MSDGKIPMLESAIMEMAGKSIFSSAIFPPYSTFVIIFAWKRGVVLVS